MPGTTAAMSHFAWLISITAMIVLRPPVQDPGTGTCCANRARGGRADASRPPSDPEQAKQMAQSLDGLRQTVERLAAAQEQIGREMTSLQAADQEILARMIPASPPLSPPAAPTRKPPAVPPQRSPR